MRLCTREAIVSEFDEGAKAAQEIARATGKAIDTARSAGGWLDRIFGQGIEHAVALRWSDRELAQRIEAAILDWERLEVLLHKVQERLQKQGVTRTRMPPPKIVLPILEHATIEHEDDLHTLWANLLASTLNASAHEIERKYVSVLAELSGADALVLRDMFAEWSFWEERKVGLERKVSRRYDSGIGGIGDRDETSVILFYRLGLLLPVNVEVNEYQPGGWDERIGEYAARSEKIVVSSDLTVVDLTEFGERFCAAVIGDVTGLYEPPDWIKSAKIKESKEPKKVE
jgi:hypothetical protein